MSEEKKDFSLQTELEAGALMLSAWVCLFMGIVGVVFAIISDSEAILLDGVFNCISCITVWMSAWLARLIHSPGDKVFPFGYMHFEPILNTTRGLLIFTVSGFALLSAIQKLLTGGSRMNPGPAVIYSVIIGAACGVMAIFQKQRAKATNSPLVIVDAQNWIVNGAITTVVGITFLAAFFMKGTALKNIVPYIDSILVIVLVLVTLPVPVKIILRNLRQVFQMAPESKVQKEILKRIHFDLKKFSTRQTRIRAVQIGRYIFLSIHAVVNDEFGAKNADEMDEIRRRLISRFDDFEQKVIVELLFTKDEHLADYNLSFSNLPEKLDESV